MDQICFPFQPWKIHAPSRTAFGLTQQDWIILGHGQDKQEMMHQTLDFKKVGHRVNLLKDEKKMALNRGRRQLAYRINLKC